MKSSPIYCLPRRSAAGCRHPGTSRWECEEVGRAAGVGLEPSFLPQSFAPPWGQLHTGCMREPHPVPQRDPGACPAGDAGMRAGAGRGQRRPGLGAAAPRGPGGRRGERCSCQPAGLGCAALFALSVPTAHDPSHPQAFLCNPPTSIARFCNPRQAIS